MGGTSRVGGLAAWWDPLCPPISRRVFLKFLPENRKNINYKLIILQNDLFILDTRLNITWNIGLSSFPEAMQKNLRPPPQRVRGVSHVNQESQRKVYQTRKFVQMKQMISYMLGTNRWKEFDK